jgi:hypothetical protein
LFAANSVGVAVFTNILRAGMDFGFQHDPLAEGFTVPNHPGKGNMHFIQKAIKGAFEVRTP